MNGRREIESADFFQGLFETARQPNELLTEIRIPVSAPDYGPVFMELSQRQGDFAMAGVAALVKLDGNVVADARLVYFATESKPTLGGAAMAALKGQIWSEATKEATQSALPEELSPFANLHGNAQMKLHLQRVLTARAMDAALVRARPV